MLPDVLDPCIISGRMRMNIRMRLSRRPPLRPGQTIYSSPCFSHRHIDTPPSPAATPCDLLDSHRFAAASCRTRPAPERLDNRCLWLSLGKSLCSETPKLWQRNQVRKTKKAQMTQSMEALCHNDNALSGPCTPPPPTHPLKALLPLFKRALLTLVSRCCPAGGAAGWKATTAFLSRDTRKELVTSTFRDKASSHPGTSAGQ